ncbi:MAG: alpha/beta fold hydrolase [Caldilineaceae bacterium]
MTKQTILSLILVTLFLTGCAMTGQVAVPASPAEVATETQSDTEETTTQDAQQAFPAEVLAAIQAEMDQLTADELPPGMVVWIDAPTDQFAGASGFANFNDKTPMSPEGAFRIGSITKMFTATVIMQLVEDGVLALDDPLALWLPEVAEQLPYGDEITLRHLLAHTSGLFNVVEHEAYFADLFTQMVVDEASGTVTLDCVERDPHDTLARYVYGSEAQFAPGTQWRYSNTNYTLLGMIIETATEMPLAEAYRTNIYEPLGMTSTFLDCYEAPLVDYVGQYEDDLADVLAAIRQDNPEHELIVLGYSMGGAVVLRHAAQHNETVDGYVLVSPNLGPEAPTARTDAPVDADPDAEPFLALHIPRIIGIAFLGGVGDFVFGAMPTMFFNLPEPFVNTYSYRAMMNSTPDYAAGFEAIDQLLLVIVGSEDETMQADVFPTLVGEYSDGVVHIVDGANHDGILYSGETISVIDDWMLGAEIGGLGD